MGFAEAASRTSRFRENMVSRLSRGLRPTAAISANSNLIYRNDGASDSRNAAWRRAWRRQVRHRDRRGRGRIALRSRRIDGGRQRQRRIGPRHRIALATRSDPSIGIEAGNNSGDTGYCFGVLLHHV
jgi:hypothetical protein